MNDFDRNNYKYWKWGMFYKNPNDPSVWVPKRTGMGWTLNFAHALAYVYLALIIIAPLVFTLYKTGVFKF
ncbi:hypothetical protein SAMN05216464_11252 [Mucilaginibacter pineti]|uniref:DUF5808 domain-containing protein n=1 Tax=Mucilaginibacter pineti TaxID=1391627 RepID=A0A1G7HWC1_9SPHI|nr:DUF5808 domain-containing protein [Mucilaginibacter pineti]SDF04685.1 hypothetical protein SAMN05216464_11252 [Mucilaginibacter pineti]